MILPMRPIGRRRDSVVKIQNEALPFRLVARALSPGHVIVGPRPVAVKATRDGCTRNHRNRAQLPSRRGN